MAALQARAAAAKAEVTNATTANAPMFRTEPLDIPGWVSDIRGMRGHTMATPAEVTDGPSAGLAYNTVAIQHPLERRRVDQTVAAEDDLMA